MSQEVPSGKYFKPAFPKHETMCCETGKLNEWYHNITQHKCKFLKYVFDCSILYLSKKAMEE
jgi:hypothetical protein